MRGMGGGRRDAVSGCVHHLHVADGADRRPVAGAHAGRAHDADARPELLRQVAQQTLGAHHGAGQGIAHAHGDGRRRCLAFLHHVEMGVEGRDLVDFGEREPHLLRQRGEMRGGEMAVPILDQVQVLDQEIAPALAIAEQRAHLVERLRVDLAAFGRASRLTAASRGWRRFLRIAAEPERSLPSPVRRIEPFQNRETIPCLAWVDRYFLSTGP